MDRQKIQDLVRAELEPLLSTPVTFGEDELLADHGLDSLASVELTLNLEDTFDITFDDDELSFEHFATLATITELIRTKVKE
jgi:acyl carrier protein